jgi:hypothetical protein
MPQFQTHEESDVRRLLPLDDDETFIGVYENTPGALDQAVVVTTKSIVLLGHAGALRVDFGDIKRATWSPESKREADKLRITLQDGTACFVPITGKSGGGADVFEFLRFVSRCSAVARGTHPAIERHTSR